MTVISYQVLAEEAAALVLQARAIVDEWDTKGEAMPAEIEAQVDSILADSTAKKEEADRLKRADTRRQTTNALYEHFHGRRNGDGDSGGAGESHEEHPAGQTDVAQLSMRAFEKMIRFGPPALTPEETRTLTEGVETAGGYLVPEQFVNELLRKIPGQTIVRQRARVITISGDSAVLPTVTGGDNMYTSGVQISWSTETPGVDEGLTEPTFGQERVLVYKMLAKTRLSKDLLEDSVIDIAGLLMDLYAESFALAEDNAFLVGSGVNRPEGVMTSPDIGHTHSGVIDNLTADSIIDLYYAIPVQYRTQGIFVMRSTTEQVIRKLKDGNGQYLWQPGLQAGDPGALLGRAVLNTDFMPALAANAEPILFGDFRGYWIIDRRGMDLQRLNEKYAEQGMIGFVADRRVGGRVMMPTMFRKLLIAV